MEETKLIYLFLSLQLDADRDEEEVFCDISMTLDNKLFPSKEPAGGEMRNFHSDSRNISFISTTFFQKFKF